MRGEGALLSSDHQLDCKSSLSFSPSTLKLVLPSSSVTSPQSFAHPTHPPSTTMPRATKPKPTRAPAKPRSRASAASKKSTPLSDLDEDPIENEPTPAGSKILHSSYQLLPEGDDEDNESVISPHFLLFKFKLFHSLTRLSARGVQQPGRAERAGCAVPEAHVQEGGADRQRVPQVVGRLVQGRHRQGRVRLERRDRIGVSPPSPIFAEWRTLIPLPPPSRNAQLAKAKASKFEAPDTDKWEALLTELHEHSEHVLAQLAEGEKLLSKRANRELHNAKKACQSARLSASSGYELTLTLWRCRSARSDAPPAPQ